MTGAGVELEYVGSVRCAYGVEKGELAAETRGWTCPDCKRQERLEERLGEILIKLDALHEELRWHRR